MKEWFGIKLLVVLAFFLFAGIAWAAGTVGKKAGIYEEALSLKNGKSMRYTLSIPESYPGKPVPLVLCLHYGGTVTPYYGRGVLAYLVEPGLRKLNAVIVAPDCPGRGWDNPVSEAAVLQLLAYIKENYHIDAKQVVVTGFSMGGIGTWYFAARHPDVFSAAIPIAGSSNVETIKGKVNIPVFVIHSRADTILPIETTEKIVADLQAGGKTVEFVILEGVDHYDTSGFTGALKGAVPWLQKIRTKN